MFLKSRTEEVQNLIDEVKDLRSQVADLQWENNNLHKLIDSGYARDLQTAREDRSILAKQLRDERVVCSYFVNLFLEAKARVAQLEYDLWDATSEECSYCSQLDA
jgi:regulator of replication initiation timing